MSRRLSTQQHERQVIESLKKYPRTMYALSDELGIHYYTVRRIIAKLHEKKLVEVSGTIDRASIYKYCGPESAKDYIPSVTDSINKASMKVTGFLPLVGNEDEMKGVKALKKLPHHITNLLYLAALSSDDSPVGKELSDLRAELQKDALIAINQANWYKQILQDPRFWDTETLRKFTDDPTWDTESVVNAKQRIIKD